VDNQETHLELTMIHEAMILEYSGSSLAMIELFAHLKQIVLYALMANVIIGIPVLDNVTVIQSVATGAIFCLKLFGIGTAHCRSGNSRRQDAAFQGG